MGKKASAKTPSSPPPSGGKTRPKMTPAEKKKLYLAILMSLVMFVVLYFTIKGLFTTSYDPELGGKWQLVSVVLEETDAEAAEAVAFRLVSDDLEEGPKASWSMAGDGEQIQTDAGEIALEELGAYQVEVLIEELTLFEAVETGLQQGIVQIAADDGTQGLVKRLQAVKQDNGQMAFYFGFDEEPEVIHFESTADAVRIQFAPAAAE